MSFRSAIIAILFAASAHAEPGPAPREIRLDSNGFALPPGAIARLGVPPAFPRSCWGLAWTLDGKRFVAADWDGFKLFDASTGRVIESFTSLPSHVPSFGTIVRDGQSMLRLIGGGPTGQLVNIETGEIILKIKLPSPLGDPGRRFYSLDMSRDHRFLVGIASADSAPGVAWRYDLAKNRYTRLINDRADLLSVRIAPDGKRVFATGGTAEPELTARDLVNGKTLWTRPIKITSRVQTISADGARLAMTDADDIIIVDTSNGKTITQFPHESGRGAGFWTVELSPDGARAAFTDQIAVKVWDLATRERQHLFPQSSECIAFSPDGQSLLTGGDWVQRWDLKTGKPQFLASHLLKRNGPRLLKWSANGQRLAAIWNEDRHVAVWNVAASELISRQNVESTVELAHLDARGERVRVYMENSVIRGWNTQRPDEATVGMTSSYRSSPNGVGEFLEDGRLAVQWPSNSGSRVDLHDPNGKIEFGRVKTIEQTYEDRLRGGNKFQGHGTTLIGPGGWRYDMLAQRELPPLQGGVSFRVMNMLSSPNGSVLAGRTIEGSQIGRFLWESSTGSVIAQLPDSIPHPNDASLSPDGRLLAIFSDERAVIHDLREPTRQWLVTEDRPSAVAFSPDGKRLAVGMSDGTILIWSVPQSTRAWSKSDEDVVWKSLQTTDARQAWGRMWNLLETPIETTQWLASRLSPIQASTDTAAWIAKLDHPKFAVREQASKVLEGRGQDIDLNLRDALKIPISSEQAARLERLIAKLNPATPPSGDELRNLRCVWLLERIGSAEALALLKKLAGGANGSRVTSEAKAAVTRLAAMR